MTNLTHILCALYWVEIMKFQANCPLPPLKRTVSTMPQKRAHSIIRQKLVYVREPADGYHHPCQPSTDEKIQKQN